MAARRTGVLLLSAALAQVWSCGGASETAAGSGVAGSSSAGASSGGGTAGVSQGGTGSGGVPGHAGSGAGTVLGGAGLAASAGQAMGGAGQAMGGAGQAMGGAGQAMGGAAQAGSSAGGGHAGAGGATEWDPELLGFDCDSERCSVGQACIRCNAGSRLCVPSPSGDPSGYAAATATCQQPLSGIFDECDGPEDCPATQFCVAAEGAQGFMRCRDQPSTAGSCCFACGAATDCTLCRRDADCPNGAACMPAKAAPAGIMGCLPSR